MSEAYPHLILNKFSTKVLFIFVGFNQYFMSRKLIEKNMESFQLYIEVVFLSEIIGEFCPKGTAYLIECSKNMERIFGFLNEFREM